MSRPNQLVRIKTALMVYRIRSVMAKENYLNAMRLFYKLYSIVGDVVASPLVLPEVNLLFASAAVGAGDEFLAFESCKMVLEQMDSRNSWWTWRYNDDEISYLRYYTKTLLLSMADSPDDEQFRLARSITLRFSELNLDRVKHDIRGAFPMSPEFGWHYDVVADKWDRQRMQSKGV